MAQTNILRSWNILQEKILRTGNIFLGNNLHMPKKCSNFAAD